MTNEEILKKAIQKAVENGLDKEVTISLEMIASSSLIKNIPELEYTIQLRLIFDHKFAKAFWGEEWVDTYGNTYEEYKKEKKTMHYPLDYEWTRRDFAWGYNLKGMVLAKEPLKYLEKFL